MSKESNDAKVLKSDKALHNAHNWKHLARWDGRGFYELQTEDTGDVRVRLFFTPQLLNDTEEILYRQIVNATRFRGVRMVVITPDAHYGYGVPVGCVLITDAEEGAVAMGPVGYDIGCFTADTLVPVVDGNSYPIGELADAGEEVPVYALSPEHKVVVAKAAAKRTRIDAPLVKVKLDNGREIKCTPDHEFMLRDGTYRQACELQSGTSLMPFHLHADRDGYKFVQHPATGTRNILAYMAERPEHFCASLAGNGERGRRFLVAYNTSPEGRRKSSEVAHRQHVCETWGETLTGGFGIHNRRRRRHGYNHKVVSVEPLEERADVYCLTVPGYGNFALDAGVFVHNCGMMSARSNVGAEAATPERRLEFNRAVMERVNMGFGGKSRRLGRLSESEFQSLVRGGAEYYVEKYGATFDRSRAERHRIPVEDSWQIPWGGKGRPERGLEQMGSLGGGNHFIELQRSSQTGTLFIQVHTGSRGFGHGLATNYFELAREEHPELLKDIDLGYFTPESKHYRDYLNAVAAGGNFAILNRLVIFEQVSEAFREVFGEGLELVYEISHNLVQKEWHPEFGDVWVHRKGATRAFPAGHPFLKGTQWEETGHPVLIPGSNKDWSYILRPLAGAELSGFSVNHGAGRRISRGEANRTLSQREMDDEYREAGVVVNTDGRVPLDEAAPCYKPSEEVVAAVVGAGLAEIEHSLWPLASLKGTDELKRGRKGKGRDKGDRNRERGEGKKTNEHY
ncbi:MAG TPA: RtcB family protein [Pyrinomonadaceae bacterium]|nr:RtcB family protein [Pyrinomonadaceae bacterium]